MPSANQMAREGLNLGEMNTALLKKVEELTLYLIEKDKKDDEKNVQLKKQQLQINQLQQQISLLRNKN